MSESTKNKNKSQKKKQGFSSNFIEKVATALQSIQDTKLEK